MPQEYFDKIIFGIEPGAAREEEKADATLEQGEKAIILSTQEDWKLHLWLEPKGEINLGNEITMNFEFHDPVTNAIIRDITYDLDIFLNGELVESKSQLHTPDGRDKRKVVFDEMGSIILRISNINSYDTGGEFAFHVSKLKTIVVDSAQIVEIAKGSAVPGCEKDNSCYVPFRAKVSPGEFVTWNNVDEASHTVTSGSPSEGSSGFFDSGVIPPGGKFSYHAEKIGEYDYYCSLHPWMLGVLDIQTPEEISIPEWIRNNAKWWADGLIGDSDFTGGIEFMIQENIIEIPDLPEQASQTGEGVPDWVRNNAGWWADGMISDEDFISGIKYLVEQGIIHI